jgi:hypothetical protein
MCLESEAEKEKRVPLPEGIEIDLASPTSGDDDKPSPAELSLMDAKTEEEFRKALAEV